jgi:hypothetical protein
MKACTTREGRAGLEVCDADGRYAAALVAMVQAAELWNRNDTPCRR